MSRTYEERLSRIDALLFLSRQDGSNLYDLSEERRAMERLAAGQISRLFAPVPKGLRQTTLDALSSPDSRFLLVDLRGRDGGVVNGSRLSLRTLRVEIRAEGPAAVFEDDGSVDGFLRVHPADGSFAHRSGDVEWSSLAHRSPGMNHTSALLPLDGPAMNHPAFVAMAAWADAALAGDNSVLAQIASIDARVRAAVQAREAAAAAMRSVALEGFDEDELDVRHAGIVALMRGHDWTWHYADAFLGASARREEEIGEALLGIPEEEALALWHLHAWSPHDENTWERAREHALNRRKSARRAA